MAKTNQDPTNLLPGSLPRTLRETLAGLDGEVAQEELIEISALVELGHYEGVQQHSGVVVDSRLPEAVRFGLLYTMLVATRRLKKYDDFVGLSDRYRAEFRGQPAMKAMHAEALSYAATTPAELRSAIAYCRRASMDFDGIGLKLLTAKTILDLLERDPDADQRLLDEADEISAEVMLVQPNRGASYAIRARVLAHLGKFASAERAFRDAISAENPQKSDYYVRLTEHESRRTELRLRELNAGLEQKQAAVLSEFESARSSMVQVLGLLAATIALVIASVQISVSLPPLAAVGVVASAGGTILMVFTGFSMLIARRPANDSVGASVMIALLLLAFGVSMVFWSSLESSNVGDAASAWVPALCSEGSLPGSAVSGLG